MYIAINTAMKITSYNYAYWVGVTQSGSSQRKTALRSERKRLRIEYYFILKFFTLCSKTDIILSKQTFLSRKNGRCALTLCGCSPLMQFLLACLIYLLHSTMHSPFACCLRQFALALNSFLIGFDIFFLEGSQKRWSGCGEKQR